MAATKGLKIAFYFATFLAVAAIMLIWTDAGHKYNLYAGMEKQKVVLIPNPLPPDVKLIIIPALNQEEFWRGKEQVYLEKKNLDYFKNLDTAYLTYKHRWGTAVMLEYPALEQNKIFRCGIDVQTTSQAYAGISNVSLRGNDIAIEYQKDINHYIKTVLLNAFVYTIVLMIVMVLMYRLYQAGVKKAKSE